MRKVDEIQWGIATTTIEIIFILFIYSHGG